MSDTNTDESTIPSRRRRPASRRNWTASAIAARCALLHNCASSTTRRCVTVISLSAADFSSFCEKCDSVPLRRPKRELFFSMSGGCADSGPSVDVRSCSVRCDDCSEVADSRIARSPTLGAVRPPSPGNDLIERRGTFSGLGVLGTDIKECVPCGVLGEPLPSFESVSAASSSSCAKIQAAAPAKNCTRESRTFECLKESLRFGTFCTRESTDGMFSCAVEKSVGAWSEVAAAERWPISDFISEEPISPSVPCRLLRSRIEIWFL
mmetsp:Transcript_23565/g.59766  ORF Transcript_23565/g.59766 Transcript_23565/m.59766 type:complete len:265 (-) Transcript_23565:3053-3847(-)